MGWWNDESPCTHARTHSPHTHSRTHSYTHMLTKTDNNRSKAVWVGNTDADLNAPKERVATKMCWRERVKYGYNWRATTRHNAPRRKNLQKIRSCKCLWCLTVTHEWQRDTREGTGLSVQQSNCIVFNDFQHKLRFKRGGSSHSKASNPICPFPLEPPAGAQTL